MPSAFQVSNNKLHIIAHSPQETNTLGGRIGRIVAPGTTIALTGDLGSGKTAFAQGLAQGLDVPDHYYITSPSYTLVNEYPGRHLFFHIDLYRIDNLSDLEEIGLYDIIYGNGVVAIEWADKLGDEIPLNHLAIYFEILDPGSRRIQMTACGAHEVNLVTQLKQIYET
ncbi:MAG: tRNA (adenosine(37)-N6)-threonylcarbamoyltransferase complex ATPase subunit type 1 TsaE [Desulfobacterales bacterium]